MNGKWLIVNELENKFEMKKNKIFWVLVFIINHLPLTIYSQSVETYAGNNRAGVDLMWFKKFKNEKQESTPILFFSRNRASVDYHNSPTAFGSTNAISYNFENGFGFVAVGSFLNSGFTPKLGVQYFKQKGDFMFFGWLVGDMEKEGSLDLFGLFRYQPKIGENLKLFSQAELFPVYSPSSEAWNLTERLRLGLKYQDFAGGLMADFNQIGKNSFQSTQNIGVFLRHEF
ncbi:MAG: hypothetical protein C4K58_04255 [Flavobacteriaceae bacterium]|nr:MAG: hypothetical protein C4K58_04255 [Flavobacteriaceae bacterium]